MDLKCRVKGKQIYIRALVQSLGTEPWYRACTEEETEEENKFIDRVFACGYRHLWLWQHNSSFFLLDFAYYCTVMHFQQF